MAGLLTHHLSLLVRAVVPHSISAQNDLVAVAAANHIRRYTWWIHSLRVVLIAGHFSCFVDLLVAVEQAHKDRFDTVNLLMNRLEVRHGLFLSLLAWGEADRT